MLRLTGFACCPRCAARALEPLGSKAARCVACGFRYFHNPAAAVAGLIERDGRILFIQRSRDPGRGLWALPGGFVDYGETLEQALKREIYEETGLEAARMEYLGSASNEYRYAEVMYLSADAYYTCAVENGPVLRCSEEVAAASWRRPDAVDPEELAFPGIGLMLSLYLQKRRRQGDSA